MAMPAQTSGDGQTTASIAIVIGGAMWGLYWLPVRFFIDKGLTGPWPGIAMYASALVFLLPFLWGQRRTLLTNWRALIFSGMFTGAAFSLFTTSLVYTEVARSILLFYLTPIWGTLLGLAFLGERLRPGRALGLVCGIGGLFVVLGGEGMPWPRNIGDWLALISGIAWALGSMGLYRAGGVSITAQTFAFVTGALVLALIGTTFTLGGAESGLGRTEVLEILPFAALSAVYVLPMILLTIWPATKLSPARVGLLLMSEVVVGLASAALFSGEPFGWREFLGASLIVTAALVEITRR